MNKSELLNAIFKEASQSRDVCKCWELVNKANCKITEKQFDATFNAGLRVFHRNNRSEILITAMDEYGKYAKLNFDINTMEIICAAEDIMGLRKMDAAIVLPIIGGWLMGYLYATGKLTKEENNHG